ncbi:hypothetical protein Syun_003783 [Stephania yunnanensis]|uniref:Protein kinase domain-containing protein n=1 Tax=Stephania yunnanensis TaxID=152371 RepID=A0AAP0Q485_9MAGN
MGLCASKPSNKSNVFAPPEEMVENNGKPSASPRGDANHHHQEQLQNQQNQQQHQQKEEAESVKRSPFFPFYSPSPARYLFSKKSPAPSANSTPKKFFKRPFPPPSPAKHIRAVLARRHGSLKPNEAAIPEGSEGEGIAGLDKSFGFLKNFTSKYELGDEVGRGHFGYTCAAKLKKGEFKGQQVAVKVIPKTKCPLIYSETYMEYCADIKALSLMTTAIAIEDVRREVKILRALTGHDNLVQFYDAYEDHDNVYIVMELCEGGELLDRILSRGGKYTEDDAKAVMLQILKVVAFCHLQGVVHRDLKPELDLAAREGEEGGRRAARPPLTVKRVRNREGDGVGEAVTLRLAAEDGDVESGGEWWAVDDCGGGV